MTHMKVLVATAMYPTPRNPAFGSFVRTQVEALKQAGVEIEVLVLDGRPRKLIYPKGIFQLRRRLADRSIDIVHAHYSLVGMVARAQWKVPVVVTYHGSDLLGSFDAHGRQTAGGRAIVAAGQLLGLLADAVIVQSEEMARKIQRPDVHIVPHEVDFCTFQPTDREQARDALGLDRNRKYLLFAAHPQNSVKRFALARAVAKQLAAEDHAIELLVVYKEPQDRLALYMNACDALVFPSYSEGSPNVVKQAMACNLPIVATNVGDVQQVIGATKGCYICPPDAAEFAARLREILRLRERTRGRQDVARFDRAIVTRQIIQVYEQALNKRRPHQGGRSPWAA
jgi:glycosyltransferase involved in cell wall biosynthesis